MKPALMLKLAERRDSTPTDCEIECNSPPLGCLQRIAARYPGVRKKSALSRRKQPSGAIHQSPRLKDMHGHEPIYSVSVALDTAQLVASIVMTLHGLGPECAPTRSNSSQDSDEAPRLANGPTVSCKPGDWSHLLTVGRRNSRTIPGTRFVGAAILVAS